MGLVNIQKETHTGGHLIDERVSIVEGDNKTPVLIVATHGAPCDDLNTDRLAEHIAEVMKCYAVINRGWRRSEIVDYFNDKADCNNFTHMQDVVKDEFLEPILRYKNRLIKKHGHLFIFFIHGMSNDIRQRTNSQLDMIIGYGAGTPPSYSCEVWRKDLFIHLLSQAGITVWEGKPGGIMSGWSKNNMNQLFRKHYKDPSVQSIQVEIIRELRNDESMAELTAEYLATAMQDLLRYNVWRRPADFKVKCY